MIDTIPTIKAVIGLGNPGKKYDRTRHNIGFMVLDTLVESHGASWVEKPLMHTASITLNDCQIQLVKPQTFMNNSGEVVPHLAKQGIKAENMLVVHDELEIPFGQVKVRSGGSARGHNGLKSIIAACGEHFYRLRCGIGRPVDKNDVPDYVLAPFIEKPQEIDAFIHRIITILESLVV